MYKLAILPLLLLIVGNAARAEQPKVAEALKMISDTAKDICEGAPLSHSYNRLELNGDASAKLSGVIKKLADMGFTGAIKYSNEETKGVLDKDLALSIKDTNDCRITIFNGLKDKLIPDLSQTEILPNFGFWEMSTIFSSDLEGVPRLGILALGEDDDTLKFADRLRLSFPASVKVSYLRIGMIVPPIHFSGRVGLQDVSANSVLAKILQKDNINATFLQDYQPLSVNFNGLRQGDPVIVIKY